ncbi:MAG: TetR/AcrR family transcriptional regulator [Solirubrobacterales bacterium]|nr:TetR/AcrR family transcriptional regulator [Solirubrobacterales bacterium]
MQGAPEGSRGGDDAARGPGRPRLRSDDELLDAAERVIARAGPPGLTLAEVAREAGIAASSLHARFGSKRALLLAASARAAPPVARRDLPPREAALDLLLRAAEPIADRETYLNTFTWLSVDLYDAEFGAHARRYVLRLRAELTAVLGDERLARAAFAAQQGAMMLWALDGEGDLLGRVREAVGAVL